MKIKKMFTLFLSLSLILNAYSFSFAKGISLAYIFMALFSVYFIIYTIKNNKKIEAHSIGLICLLFIISIFSFSIFPERLILQSNLFTYILKLLLWGIILCFPVKEIIEKEYFLKCIVRISTLATIYLIIQFIMSAFFSINLSNVFSFGIISTSGDLSLLSSYRPASFFSEPAYYSTYVLCTLSILLLENIDVKHKKLLIILFAFGVLLSTSTAGIYMLLVLFLFYCIKNRKHRKLILTSFIIIPIVLIITVNFNSILKHLGNFGNVLTLSLEKPTHYSTLSRLGGSFDYLKNLSGLDKLIGWGVGNEYIYLGVESTYINSIARLIIQFGYIGAFAFLIFILKYLKKCKSLLGLFILTLYIIKSFSGGAMFSISGIYMLALYKFVTNEFNIKLEKKS